jgi:hypothetical protein
LGHDYGVATPIRASLHFLASPKAVFEMLHDSGYLSAKSQLAIDSAASVDRTDSGSTVTLQRRLTSDLPEMARKFLGDEISVLEIQNWELPKKDGSAQAKLTVTISGAPVTVEAEMKLFGDKSGTTIELTGSVKVAVPIFGAMAEGAVAGELEKIISLEQAIGENWLANN